MSSLAAARVVKKFRLDQFLRVESHIRQLGPLSEHTTPPIEPGSKVPVLPNPFIPRKSPKNQSWRPPVYSLRRQADLVKKAKATGLLHLLPHGPKNPLPRTDAIKAVERTQNAADPEPLEALKCQLKDSKEDKSVWMDPVAWEGRVRSRKAPGADLGITLYAGKKKMFKGHKWERVRDAKGRRRGMLLRSMRRRIYNYKNVGRMFLSRSSDTEFPVLVLQAEKARSPQTTQDFQGAQTAFLVDFSPIYFFVVGKH
jgi:large subunit ribosomal protein L25